MTDDNTTAMRVATIAKLYIEQYGLALVKLPPGQKYPTHERWEQPGGYFTDAVEAAEFYTRNPNWGVGAVLGPSRLCSLDIDNVEEARIVFSEFGIDIDAWADQFPTVVGNPERFRIMFRLPEGVELSKHVLRWPDKDDPTKKHVVFELRAGAGAQDVLPPTTHPDTGQPYTWRCEPTDGFAELPAQLLTYWREWGVFGADAARQCPWAPEAPKPPPKPPKPRRGDERSPIEAYNDRHDIGARLEHYGYKPVGRRYLSPHSNSGVPGVVLIDENRCYIHHASDPLGGRPVNPFDLFCQYDHAGDVGKAVRAAAEELGIAHKTGAERPVERQAAQRAAEAAGERIDLETGEVLESGPSAPVKVGSAATQPAKPKRETPARRLDLAAWRSSRFVGDPPPIKYLVAGSLPLGVPGLVTAAGDTGKSMALLELGRRVAFGSTPCEPPIFGGSVAVEGTVVMLTSEDDEAAVHRRLAAMDARNSRFTAKGERLIVVPLPSAGGAYPLFRGNRDGMARTEEFEQLRDQLAAIPDLKLIVFDPMQSFVLGPINEDPAAGQFACTEIGSLAADTGATTLFAHHVKKTPQAITSLPQAREAVRGTTAIVDGVRFAFALWPAEPDEAKKVCKELGKPYEHNKIVRGGVIKANGPARRIVRTYVRNDFGLLIDETASLRDSAVDQEDRLLDLVEAIKGAADRGRPFTKGGLSGLFSQRERLPVGLRTTARHKLEGLAQDALDRGLVVQAMASGSKVNKWLDVPDGPFARGEGEFVIGGEVVDEPRK